MKKQNHLQIVLLLLIILGIFWFFTSKKQRESQSPQNSKNKVEIEGAQNPPTPQPTAENKNLMKNEKNFSSQNTTTPKRNENTLSTHSPSGPTKAVNPNEGKPIVSPPPVIGPTGKISGLQGPLSTEEESNSGPQAVKGPHQQ